MITLVWNHATHPNCRETMEHLFEGNPMAGSPMPHGGAFPQFAMMGSRRPPPPNPPPLPPPTRPSAPPPEASPVTPPLTSLYALQALRSNAAAAMMMKPNLPALHALWSQWAQIQQLNYALLTQRLAMTEEEAGDAPPPRDDTPPRDEPRPPIHPFLNVLSQMAQKIPVKEERESRESSPSPSCSEIT